LKKPARKELERQQKELLKRPKAKQAEARKEPAAEQKFSEQFSGAVAVKNQKAKGKYQKFKVGTFFN
jgi:hypothetical protein